MPVSQASNGHLGNPVDKDQDSKLGTVTDTCDLSLRNWRQESDEKFIIKVTNAARGSPKS